MAEISQSPVAAITSLWQQGSLTAPAGSSSTLMCDPVAVAGGQVEPALLLFSLPTIHDQRLNRDGRKAIVRSTVGEWVSFREV